MSVGTYVFLRRDRRPPAGAWAEAIRREGFPLELPTDFDSGGNIGFLPCRYEGDETGFEYSFGELASAGIELAEEQRRQLGDRDAVAVFVTGSDQRGTTAAAVAAGVLASLSDGIVHDDYGAWTPAGQAIAWARLEQSGTPQSLAPPSGHPLVQRPRVLSPVLWAGVAAVLLGMLYRCIA